MDTNLHFECTDIDQLSSISTAHLAFVINQLLPRRLIGRHRYEKVDKELEGRQFSDDAVKVLAVGSLSEALNMPPLIVKREGYKVYGDSSSDVDLMFVVESVSVTFDRQGAETGEYFAYADTTDVHPGYAHLQRSGTFLDHHFIKEAMKAAIVRVSDRHTEADVDVSGPAVTTQKEAEMTLENFKQFDRSFGPLCSTDHVMGISCQEWAPIAEQWKSRPRVHNWPTQEAIKDLVRDGCHVVPVPHRRSPSPNKEWRISFTLTERRICREIVTEHQRQGYIFLKILYHQNLKEKEIISTYHLKTIFLYSCELIPVSAWEENVGTCVFFMLDLLLECASKKTLPNYFVPENNMFDYLSEDDMDALQECVMDIRIDPLSCVFCFTDDKTVGMASLTVTFRKLMEPVMQDMQSYLKHSEIKRSISDAFSVSSFHHLLAQLYEGKVEEAVKIAEDLYDILAKFDLTKRTLPEFLFWYICRNIKNLRLGVAFLEQVVQSHGKESGYECCSHNLPSLYHACALSFPQDSAERETFMKRAETAFKTLLEEHKSDGLICDYVLLLMKQRRFEDAVSRLAEIIQRKDKTTSHNSYEKSESSVLTDELREEVLEHGPFSLPAVSLAHYLMFQCLKQRQRGDDTNKRKLLDFVMDFKQLSLEQDCGRVHALVGRCFVTLGEWQEASDAFRRAVDCGLQRGDGSEGKTDYTLAASLKRSCDDKLS